MDFSGKHNLPLRRKHPYGSAFSVICTYIKYIAFAIISRFFNKNRQMY